MQKMPKKAKLKNRRVGVISDDSQYDRAVLSGVVGYMKQHTPWDLYTKVWVGMPYLQSIKEFTGEGLIYIGSDAPDETRRDLAALDIPVVYAAMFEDGLELPCVVVDEKAVGRRMAEHLMGQGLMNFGYFGEAMTHLHAINLRQEGFIEALEQAGRQAEVYVEPGPWCHEEGWWEIQDRLVEWIRTLPKPVGLGVYCDPRAVFLLHACQRGGISVPEEVAVVAADNDPIVCGLIRPSLSSVDLGCRRVGYRAAELLDGRMRGRPAPKKPILLEPLEVIQRRSSDIEAIEDPVVRKCFYYIRDHLGGGVSVSDLLGEVQISQRNLEMRFRKSLGRTPAVEIRRMQIEKAKKLLLDNGASIAQIAYACGFPNQTRFGVAFRRAAGQTPTAYRKQIREG